MSFELRLDRSLGKNIRRIFRQQLDSALDLVRGDKKPKDTLVHDVRKHLKKARAVLRLVRKEIGRDLVRREDHRLRDAGRLMTEIRDAEVRLQTMRQLEEVTRHHYRSYQKLEQLLFFELQSLRLALSDWQRLVIPLVEQARDGAAEWRLGKYDSKDLIRALQRTYESGRKALAVAKIKPSATNIHELRKHVKLLGYQLRIVQPWNHFLIGELIGELTALGHLLGRVHDLTFLGDRLRVERSESHWGKQDDDLLAMIELSESELQRDGIEIAQRFFAEGRSNFGARIKEWFDNQARPKSIAESLLVSA